jgi:hypothetical protein
MAISFFRGIRFLDGLRHRPSNGCFSFPVHALLQMDQVAKIAEFKRPLIIMCII